MKYIISYSVKKGLPDISLLTGGVYFGYYERYHLNISNRISNPWRIKALRKLTGLAPEVQEFLTRCKRTEEHLSLFYNKFKYGRRVVSIGCTGGKHRSVAMAEMLAVRMRENGMQVTVIHRDLPVEVSNG